MNPKEQYYKNLSIAFKNELIMNRCLATVHLEDRDDKMFWDTVLQAYRPGNYNYKFHSRNAEGNETTGCKQCLKFRDYIDSKFFICVDSDLSFFRNDPNFNAAHFIMQTYCYSWENHYCFAEKLQTDFADKCPEVACNFDFRVFLSNYSAAVYEYYLQFLYLGRTGNSQKCSKKKFDSLIVAQFKKGDDKSNGNSIVYRVRNQLGSFFSNLDLVSFDEISEKEYYQSRGLTASNLYLYLCGHNIENLLVSIGSKLCENTGVNFKTDILYHSLSLEAYPEINMVKADLQSF